MSHNSQPHRSKLAPPKLPVFSRTNNSILPTACLKPPVRQDYNNHHNTTSSRSHSDPRQEVGSSGNFRRRSPADLEGKSYLQEHRNAHKSKHRYSSSPDSRNTREHISLRKTREHISHRNTRDYLRHRPLRSRSRSPLDRPTSLAPSTSTNLQRHKPRQKKIREPHGSGETEENQRLAREPFVHFCVMFT